MRTGWLRSKLPTRHGWVFFLNPGKPLPATGDQRSYEGVWDALPTFTFGTPDLVSLPDASVFLAYYATINGVTHIRACRFRLTD